jgi:hypothetical protein
MPAKRKEKSPLSSGKGAPPEKSSASEKTSNSPPPNKQAPPKQLSGALMGMRFMQRKAKAQEAAAVAAETAAKRRRQEEEDDSNEVDCGQESEPPNDEKTNMTSQAGKDGETEAAGKRQKQPKQRSRPLLATDADMYGIEADLIGRRSFGGFNKAVSDTWQAAYVARQKETSAEGSNKSTLTDEELLLRYEKYVRGGN